MRTFITAIVCGCSKSSLQSGQATAQREPTQTLCVESLVADSTASMVAMQYIAERKTRKQKICIPIFVAIDFFRDAPMRAPSRVQSVKTRSFAASLQSLTVVFHILFH
ncbi:MAG TPA: hypothetical protein VGQ12_01700 [Candidatus Angelobacter sp.]|nr:hypothetical protein [Candidatus Angelobacter sp.]